MSYHGKAFKRVKTEHIQELVEKLKLGDRVGNLLTRSETLSYYEKNPDGSVQFKIKKGDDVVINQKIENNKEIEFTSPDGELIKSIATIDDNSIKSIVTRPDGKKINFDRYFIGNTMKVEISVPGIDIKGILYYEAV